MEDDTPEQAAVLPILSKMQVNQLLQLCRTINVDCDSHIHKEDVLPKFMGDHDAVFSADSHLQADAAATFAAAATMTPPLPPAAAATLSPPLPPQPPQLQRLMCHDPSTRPTSNNPPQPFSSFARQEL